jgi:hypothetical protein
LKTFTLISSTPVSYISDLCITYGKAGESTTPPAGFTKLAKIDLNKGAEGKYMYLCYKKSTDPKDAIVDICFIKGNDKTPTGYTKIEADLNMGAGGKYIYLCYTKDDSLKPNAFPILDISLLCWKLSAHGLPEAFPIISGQKADGKTYDSSGDYYYSDTSSAAIQDQWKRNYCLNGWKFGSFEKYGLRHCKVEQDLNEGAEGYYIYLTYFSLPGKIVPSLTGSYVADITTENVFRGESKWIIPPGYSLLGTTGAFLATNELSEALSAQKQWGSVWGSVHLDVPIRNIRELLDSDVLPSKNWFLFPKKGSAIAYLADAYPRPEDTIQQFSDHDENSIISTYYGNQSQSLLVNAYKDTVAKIEEIYKSSLEVKEKINKSSIDAENAFRAFADKVNAAKRLVTLVNTLKEYVDKMGASADNVTLRRNYVSFFEAIVSQKRLRSALIDSIRAFYHASSSEKIVFLAEDVKKAYKTYADLSKVTQLKEAIEGISSDPTLAALWRNLDFLVESLKTPVKLAEDLAELRELRAKVKELEAQAEKSQAAAQAAAAPVAQIAVNALTENLSMLTTFKKLASALAPVSAEVANALAAVNSSAAKKKSELDNANKVLTTGKSTLAKVQAILAKNEAAAAAAAEAAAAVGADADAGGAPEVIADESDAPADAAASDAGDVEDTGGAEETPEEASPEEEPAAEETLAAEAPVEESPEGTDAVAEESPQKSAVAKATVAKATVAKATLVTKRALPVKALSVKPLLARPAVAEKLGVGKINLTQVTAQGIKTLDKAVANLEDPEAFVADLTAANGALEVAISEYDKNTLIGSDVVTYTGLPAAVEAVKTLLAKVNVVLVSTEVSLSLPGKK